MPTARSSSRILKVAVSLALLGLAAYMLDWHEALSLLRNTSVAELSLGLTLLLGAYLVNGIRLMCLQHRAGLAMPAPLFWGSYYTGLAFNNLLPSGVGGDAVRVLLLTRRGYPVRALAVSGLSDRFFGLLGVFAVVGLAMVIFPSSVPMLMNDSRWLGGCLLVAVAVGLWWLPRIAVLSLGHLSERPQTRWGRVIGNGKDLLQQVFDRPGRLIAPTALSVLSHTLFILSYASCGHSLLPNITPAIYFIAIPGVMLLLLLPISVGGLGVREVSTVGLLVWFGAEPQAALTLSLVFLAIIWISVIPGFFGAVHYGVNAFALKDRAHEP